MISSEKVFNHAERRLTARRREGRISALVSNKAGTHSRWEDVTPIKEPSYQEVLDYINGLSAYDLLCLLQEVQEAEDE